MKYQSIQKKLEDKVKSLVKSKKELVPLKISLTQRSFNELQEDIVLHHQDLEEDYKLVQLEDDSYRLKHPSVAIEAHIQIV